MRCLDAAQIARAATSGLDDVHFGECLACRRQLERDRFARSALRAIPAPVLAAPQRRALAAEIFAAAPSGNDPPPRVRIAGGVAVAAAIAATIALVARWPVRADRGPVVIATTDEPVAMRVTNRAHDAAPPALAAPQIDASGGAVFAHVIGPDRDVLTLVDGIVELDTRSARNVDVRVGDTIVRVDDAAVTIRARGRSIASVRVVIGTARIHTRDHHLTLQRDSVWLPAPSAEHRSLAAFRDAWIALRSGRNREAMELFDHVTDPVAIEEATYWAAVAAKRAGETADANLRLARFLERFPHSEYAAKIRDDAR